MQRKNNLNPIYPFRNLPLPVEHIFQWKSKEIVSIRKRGSKLMNTVTKNKFDRFEIIF